ncbi:MAG: Asp23/Gls24 family envelope stress response protein [Clostridiales bacterium]|nr:Asp23/Gls24 family envelope stress response protein [Clostridiales bacterium]
MDQIFEEKNVLEQDIASTSVGTVKIANDVVATIAGLSAIEVAGVAGMSGGVVGGIAEMLGIKNLTKGIKVNVGEEETTIDIFVIVEFGVAIPDLAQNLQNAVKSAVETMTGLKVIALNVHIQGVTFPQGHPAIKSDKEKVEI